MASKVAVISSNAGGLSILDKNYNLEMVPILGGEFLMGSPLTEKNRLADEGPWLVCTYKYFPENMGKTVEELLEWEKTEHRYNMIQKVLPYLKKYAMES